MAMIILSC